MGCHMDPILNCAFAALGGGAFSGGWCFGVAFSAGAGVGFGVAAGETCGGVAFASKDVSIFCCILTVPLFCHIRWVVMAHGW